MALARTRARKDSSSRSFSVSTQKVPIWLGTCPYVQYHWFADMFRRRRVLGNLSAVV